MQLDVEFLYVFGRFFWMKANGWYDIDNHYAMPSGLLRARYGKALKIKIFKARVARGTTPKYKVLETKNTFPHFVLWGYLLCLRAHYTMIFFEMEGRV